MINLEELTKKAIDFGGTVLIALITLIIGFWLAGKIGNILRKSLDRRGVDSTVSPFLVTIVKVALKIMVLISVAGVFGVETTSFIAVLGAATLAIGLALQGTLGHFASGVLLLVFSRFE